MPTYKYIPRPRHPRWARFQQLVRDYTRLLYTRADGRDYTGWEVRLTRPRFGQQSGAIGDVRAVKLSGTRRCRHIVGFDEGKELVWMVLPSRSAELSEPSNPKTT